MKKFIVGLEEDWMAVIFGIMGILLIIFPTVFTIAIPYMLGLGLIVCGILGLISYCKYKSDSDVKPGRIIIYIVLGIAILCHDADAIGPIGAIWAMTSLYEVSEEITEDFENKSFSVGRIIIGAITIALAILLMFDPFEHFTVHVLILGIEMLTMVFVRKRNLTLKKKDS